MSRKIQVMLHDDLDGGNADETMSFALDGITYEIDLSKRNATALRATLSRYIKAARTTRKPGRPTSASLLAPVTRVPACIAVGARAGASSAQRAATARSTGHPSAASRLKVSGGNSGINPAAVRQWAKGKGMAVSERGRLSSQIISKYIASQR
ncbi:MAG: Lsr2 family protein [Actinobacteria bacterium]|nr:Lsr2 family protein [Actinomycetota bacterium]